jgi:hypothetical protein
VKSQLAVSLFSALSTTTTNPIVHQGSALPAARVVIIAVPTIALTALWWLTRHRGRGRGHP